MTADACVVNRGPESLLSIARALTDVSKRSRRGGGFRCSLSGLGRCARFRRLTGRKSCDEDGKERHGIPHCVCSEQESRTVVSFGMVSVQCCSYSTAERVVSGSL